MTKKVNLALQGGGAHGAFTWGVLDRLLEDDEIEIAGMSGTSAGALNGAALKAGMLTGGREGARENLDWLWGRIGSLGEMRLAGWMAGMGPSAGAISQALEYSMPFNMADAATRVFSPYLSGPFYRNPLEDIASRFKYDAICADEGPAFFVCATNVETGKVKIFSGEEITTKAILASSCLPTVRAINFVQRLITKGSVGEGAMKRGLVHMIADDALMAELSVASKTIPVPGIIFELRDAGRSAADDFLTRHRDKIGVASSVDLAEMYE